MMIGSNTEYIKAYTELNCLLKYFPKEYIKKLPIKLLQFIDRNSKEEYKIQIDINTDLQNMNLSSKTYSLLSVLKYNYWSTEEEKEYIKAKLNENEIAFQEKLRENYKPEDIFKNNTQYKKTERDLQTIEKEESILEKLIGKIKKFLKRNS